MKKKYVIPAVFVILLIAIVAVLATIKETNSQNTASTIKVKKENTGAPVVQTAKKVDVSNLSSYDDPKYTLYYPKTWVQSKSEMTDKTGTVYLLQPQDSSLPSHPHMTVEVVDAKLKSIADMSPEFAVFGYKKTTETLNGTTATKYQRTIPSSEGTLHSTAYLYQKNGTIYLFKLGYKQDAVDSELENEFAQVAGAFSIH